MQSIGTDQKAPVWQNSLLSTAPSSSKSAALAAPLPAPGVLPSNAAVPPQPPQTLGAQNPKPPESEGAPSMVDGDFGEPAACLVLHVRSRLGPVVGTSLE